MSRTDVHRPYEVQLRDPYNRHRLYRYPAYGNLYELAFTYNVCGCDLCTDHFWHKWQRRKERAQGRRYCRTWYREYE
jgi:hypothetical protein